MRETVPQARKIRSDLGLPPRYRLEQNGRNHALVLDEHGFVLRMPGGMPVAVALTPSDHRTRLNEKARVRRALRARGIFN